MGTFVNVIANRLPVGLVKKISALQWRSPWLARAHRIVVASYGKGDNVIQRGPAKGLKLNLGLAHNAGFVLGTYEPEVQRIYASLVSPGMTVYDVGAHIGFLAILAARLVGPKGSVACFEPLPANAETIRHNAVINRFTNITVIPEALGKESAISRFTVARDVGWGRLAEDGAPMEREQIEVSVTRLARAIEEYWLPLPDLIKVDIEKGEIGMLEGARDLLVRCRPFLLIELHGTNLGVGRILNDLGYNSYVVGNPQPITEARWDAFVVAAPKEDKRKCVKASDLARSAALSR